MKSQLTWTVALLTGVVGQSGHAQSTTSFDDAPLETVLVTAQRDSRTSKGATGLPIDIKETPQTISVIDQDDIANFGVTDSNEALRLGTGINVEQYETNRAVYNARGFEVQLTQVDGLGMTNDYGTVVGQQDTYLFEKIELIRGANGLLTGVGNSSGTINYVRKRPKNEDVGQVEIAGGSYDYVRAALDYNKVFTDNGSWAGRFVVAYQDKDSHLRALNDKRTTLYGVVDGQIGTNGILTLGMTYQDSKQKSPMWGSLTLYYVDGSMADFDDSASTSQDWTFWNTKYENAFVEYTHRLSDNWQAKVTYNQRHSEEEVRLLYAYALSANGGLNLDNTGLVGWPYGSYVTTNNNLFDANLTGQFDAFGREHSVIAGISHSRQETSTDTFNYDTSTYLGLALPAFPYAGNVYPEPEWSAKTPASSGQQRLTRLYAATRFALSDDLKLIGGVNAIRLEREGDSRYGSLITATSYPDTKKVSPYAGITYDFTGNILGYVSYSNIFQNQDQTDYNGVYLDPMKGVNYETGIKADWLDKKLLTTFAVFTSEQKGLATYAGINAFGNYYYVPKDVKSKGFEIEATGRIGDLSKLTLGFTKLKLTGPDGNDIYEWVPRTVVNLRFDSKVPGLTNLRLGFNTRWQSEVLKSGGARQDAYFLTNTFASYALTKKLDAKVNVDNIFNQKYIGGLSYGAIYGEPRSYKLTLDYNL